MAIVTETVSTETSSTKSSKSLTDWPNSQGVSDAFNGSKLPAVNASSLTRHIVRTHQSSLKSRAISLLGLPASFTARELEPARLKRTLGRNSKLATGLTRCLSSIVSRFWHHTASMPPFGSSTTRAALAMD